MRTRGRHWIWVLGLYVASLAIVGTLALAIAYGLPQEDGDALARIVEARAALLVAAAALLFALCAGAISWLFANYHDAARSLAEQADVVLRANPDHRVNVDAGSEMIELAQSINRIADGMRLLQRDLEVRSAEARARVEEERNRLAALMSELTQAVLVCNAEGQILLYNERARGLFSRIASEAAPLGLGRSIFALLDRGQVAHALDKLGHLLEQGQTQPLTRFVASVAGGTVLGIQVAPFLSSARRLAGLVFMLEDVTGSLGDEVRRHSLLLALARDARAPVANLRAAAENLAQYPDMDPGGRARFVDVVVQEARVLSKTLDAALREHAGAPQSSVALEDMRANDFVTVARRAIETAVDIKVESATADGDFWVRVDSYAFVRALAYVAARLRSEHGVREIRLRIEPSAGFAAIDVLWSGAAVPAGTLAAWETVPMTVGRNEAPITLNAVLEQHGAESWCEPFPDGARLRFLLPAGEPVSAVETRMASAEARPEYYDFDLFERRGVATQFEDRRLAELHYTAFDTETTGLDPSAGDEIISIGAVRIVNGRLLKHEVFERLVDPRRPLNPESARIHGIVAAALEGQPTIVQVLPTFHRFCEDSVLVAHNAAFDMRFLELKEAASGVRFAQPVLDTLLLSSIAQPGIVNSTLEAIADRLGVRVIGRHTALGDALVTGEIFLRLLPLLAERGIVTLRQALDASRQTYHARVKY